MGLWEKSKRMHRIHCIPLLSDPVHWASAQYLNFLTMESLQGVENDIAQKTYVPSSFKNSCPGINILRASQLKYLLRKYGRMPACNLHCMCNFKSGIFKTKKLVLKGR